MNENLLLFAFLDSKDCLQMFRKFDWGIIIIKEQYNNNDNNNNNNNNNNNRCVIL